MLVSAERSKAMLISREIIFQEFRPMWSRYLNVTDRKDGGRAGKQTDRQLAIALLRSA